MSQQDELLTLREHLAALVNDLERMPAFKVGTPYEADRIRERDLIRRQIARLEANS
jgi:hypothetical protein